MKRLLSIALCLLLIIVCGCSITQKSPQDLQQMVNNNVKATDADVELFRTVFERETEWLASLQLENGAIPMTGAKNGEVSVNPYFSDFAALALLDDTEKYADNVKKYMDWHFGHLNTSETDYNGIDGTIYDYKITLSDGKIIEEKISEKDGRKSYDSTDSYAATFLMVINKYYNTTGDNEYIISRSREIERITKAMLSTLHKGLTFAKPDYEVKYLMDNSEVYEGMISAVSLFKNVISDTAYNGILKECEKAAAKLLKAFEKDLWNSHEKYYESGIFRDGKAISEFSWDTYYPCATAQLFPVIHGVISAETQRANDLYDKFCETFNWEDFDIPSTFCWGSNVYAAALMNDVDRVVTYMENYLDYSAEHEYPLYNADSAKVCMAAYVMLQRNS
ncbi:MAG: hypothetical protein IKL10_07810 [Clostridia bacterium]|nr:hypothetical protein [Clostridia bacterium]